MHKPVLCFSSLGSIRQIRHKDKTFVTSACACTYLHQPLHHAITRVNSDAPRRHACVTMITAHPLICQAQYARQGLSPESQLLSGRHGRPAQGRRLHWARTPKSAPQSSYRLPWSRHCSLWGNKNTGNSHSQASYP